MTDRRQVIVGVEPLVMEPKDGLPLAKHHTQLLYGETFVVQEEKDGWCFGKCETDGYEGWIRSDALSKKVFEPTHRVAVLRSATYLGATTDGLSQEVLSFCSPVCVVEEKDGFARLAHGNWVRREHLVPIDEIWPDHTATAEKFLGIPYLWSGRSSAGIDCSALVQLALIFAGVSCPRDSGPQRNSDIGKDIDFGDPMNPANLRRGDIVLFQGHVGIMADDKNLLHANSTAMATTKDPVESVAQKCKGGVLAVKRRKI